MNKLKCFLLLFLIAGVLTNCRKQAFDEYYGRPDNLQPPIYQQLEAKGNFKNLLAVIDKAGYKSTLSAAGYWTMFAPNDAAFQKFLSDRGLPDVSKLDSGTAKQIVTYALVYNAFTKAELANYQANTGWVANQGFKRRTANYVGFYTDTTNTGQKVTAISSNRNGSFVLGDNNNKYIPYFIDNYMSARGLSAYDYNYFYPNTNYTGFNVVDATVANSDIVAENGIIHEIDKVILPLPNIDQYLAANPQYSEFKKLFDKYMVSFVLNSGATDRYKLLTGLDAQVYVKTFNGALGFSPNNENYMKVADNDGQTNGWTLFVPTNQVLLDYINNVLLENYKSLDQLPLQIIIDFINAHMWQTNVWPSKFASSNNVQSEPARFNPATDIVDKKILSNGIFYGTNKVQQANVFSTVYGKAYLDPRYLLMTRLLDQNLRYVITVPNVKYTVIMMSDSVLKAYGYDYNTTQSQWQYTVPGTSNVTISSSIASRLQRILATHIIPTPNGELDNLSGSGIVETYGGDYIKYANGKLMSSGSQDSGYVVTVTGTKTAVNGRVYYADNLLTNTNKTVANSILALAPNSSSNFYDFAMMIKNSNMYNPTTGEFTPAPVGVFYTVFVPTNAAIVAAANAGLLPKKTTGAPNIDNASPAWSAADRELVNNFLKYHILNRTTVVPDGKKNGSYETTYKNAAGDPGTLNISGAAGTMQVTDNLGRKANVIIASSNNLADRTVIHLIDNYLQYSN